LVYGNVFGKSDVGGGKKKRKKDCPINFFKKYSSMSMWSALMKIDLFSKCS
jgi:hypothetical protein